MVFECRGQQTRVFVDRCRAIGRATHGRKCPSANCSTPKVFDIGSPLVPFPLCEEQRISFSRARRSQCLSTGVFGTAVPVITWSQSRTLTTGGQRSRATWRVTSKRRSGWKMPVGPCSDIGRMNCRAPSLGRSHAAFVRFETLRSFASPTKAHRRPSHRHELLCRGRRVDSRQRR